MIHRPFVGYSYQTGFKVPFRSSAEELSARKFRVEGAFSCKRYTNKSILLEIWINFSGLDLPLDITNGCATFARGSGKKE